MGDVRAEDGLSLMAAEWPKSKSASIEKHINFYEHQRLNTTRNEIRLLKLSCKVNEPGISGSLNCFSIEDAPPYDALSYTWDSTTICIPLLLDGKEFYISWNLTQALRRLRSEFSREGHSHISLWIDAICINQKDAAERNHQVRKMRQIYERAACVRIWLGGGTKQSGLAFTLARDMAKAALVHQEEELFNDPQRINQFVAFQKLLHRGYWNRIWVIQEVNAAVQAEVICGKDTISWRDLLVAQNAIVSCRDSCWKLVRYNPILAKFSSDVYYEGPRGLVIQGNVPAQTPTLFEALRWHCTKVSTEPADRIYGLLGLTTAGEDPQYILDYSRGTQQIFMDAAIYIIKTTRSLDIICIMHQPKTKAKLLVSKMPRWVPDWLNGSPSWLLDSSIDIFDASMSIGAQVSFPSGGSILAARGFCIASILATGPSLLLDEEDDTKNISALLSMFYEWLEMANPSTESEMEAFCRTFTCGRIMEELDLLTGLPQDRALRRMLGVFAQLSRGSITHSATESYLHMFADEVLQLGKIQELEAWARVILLDIKAIINRRRFISVDTNAMGMAYHLAEKGDKICILLGCSTPVILRPFQEKYEFIGDVYVDGYMFGRGVIEAEAGAYQWEHFLLV